MRTARETAIGQECDIFAETSAHDSRGGFHCAHVYRNSSSNHAFHDSDIFTRILTHFGHTRSTLGTFAADNDNGLFTFLEFIVLQSSNKSFFAFENAGFASEDKTLLTGNLGDGTFGCEVTLEDLQVSSFLDRFRQWTDNLLSLGKAREGVEVLGETLAGNSQDVSVDQLFLQQVLEDGGDTTDLM